MSASELPSAGLTRATKPATNSRSLLEVVARKHGVSPFRQMADMWKLKGGANQIVAAEYYEYQLYLPEMTPAQKKEFVGEKGSFALNLRLAPPNFTHQRNFLADKVALTTMMGALGLPTTTIQACFHPYRGFGQTLTLRDAAAIRAFLTGPARYPLFGKPIRGAGSFGSVSIRRIEGEVAHLANGATIPLASLCDQIAGCTEFGYVFQDAVIQHPQVAEICGSAGVSTIRAVTVNDNDRPRMLYALWKLPAAGAMSDNFWQKGSLIALIDHATGQVQKVRYGTGPDTQWVQDHPVTGARLAGITLPGWDKVVTLAESLHAVMPDNGILGWDIALTPEGARLIECNENTGHGLYQLASGRGVLNADFAPTFAAVEARNARLLAAISARKAAHAKAKALA